MSAVSRIFAATLALSILSPAVAVWAQDTAPVPQAPGSAPSTAEVIAFPARPSDTIRVVVAGAQDLSGEFRVDADDGTITIAQIGTIPVAGLSKTDVTDRIVKRIKQKQLLKEPNVAIYLIARKAREVSINGAVTTQGSRTVKDGTTLSEVLEGATPLQTADLSRVVVTHEGKDTVVDYKKYQAGEERGDAVNPVLQDGDKVYVYSTVQSAGVVSLTGEVKDNTKVQTQINKGTTVGQLIQQAGGLTDVADRDNIVLVRGEQRTTVNYLDIQRGVPGSDLELHDGDRVVVARANHIKQFAIMGAVRDAKTVPLFPGEAITVTDAIGRAGGFTDGARQDKIVLYRPDSNGKVIQRKIDITKGTDAMLALQDGDLLSIPYPKGRGSVDAFSAVGLLSGLSLIFQGFR